MNQPESFIKKKEHLACKLKQIWAQAGSSMLEYCSRCTFTGNGVSTISSQSMYLHSLGRRSLHH